MFPEITAQRVYLKRLFFLFSTLLIVGMGSCRKYSYQTLNTNPNQAQDVPLTLLLPAAELSTALVYGMESSWYTAVIMQQQGGVDRQMKSADHYSIQPQDVNNPWTHAYIHPLPDLKAIISKAEAQSAYSYSGVAKILTAMILGQLTDLWGDIPYTQALQGSANIAPAYDTQEQIYNTIFRLLTEAKADLAKPSKLNPSRDDLIFSGNLIQWKKTANALLARYYNHVSKIDPAGSAAKALAAIDEGSYQSVQDDARLRYGEAATESNPWYQFMSQRNDMRMGKYLVDLMRNSNDPRLPKYATEDANLNFTGSPAGAPDLYASSIDSFFASPASYTTLISYEELKFIEAEAALRAGNLQRAADACNAAVLASLRKYDVYDSSFVEVYAHASAGSITLPQIMSQKYIALLTQAESWTDYRRTTFPSIQPAIGNITGGIIPRRFPYPSDELNFNRSHVPENTTLTDRVWWDK